MNVRRLDWINIFISLNFITFMVTFSFSGCFPGHPQLSPENIDPDQQILATAEQAFYQGDFKSAEKSFRALQENTLSPDIRKISLYGLACTQFMLAENQDTFQQAYALWQTWEQIPGQSSHGENPSMFGPILEKVMSDQWCNLRPRDTKGLHEEMKNSVESNVNRQNTTDATEISPEVASPQTDASPVDQQKVSTASDESVKTAELRKLLQSREKEILRLKRQISKMEKERNALKEQIHTIEEIHQEILEKKKGMDIP